MLKVFVILFGITLLLNNINATEFRGQLQIGQNVGKSAELSISAFNFATGLPLAARLRLAKAGFNPGDAVAARKIFINNNQGGTIRKSGSAWLGALDFLYPVDVGAAPESFVYFGPRLSKFKANFKYIGDNEDFDVVSNQWGWGAGLESGFPMTRKIVFNLSAGVDFFKSSTLTGHDTSYSPDGTINNQRENYQYEDADNAINQPGFEPRLMLGFTYKFGK